MKLFRKVKKEIAMGLVVATTICVPIGTLAKDYDNHWAKDAIEKWQGYGILSGYEDGSFKPNNQITRAEFAVILCKLFNLQEVDQTIKFDDVKQDKWYAEAINKVVAAGMMQGDAEGFSPNETITRQEVAVAIVNACQIKTKGNQPLSFKDQDEIADWAKEAVEILFSYGYISGKSESKFEPNTSITRAEVMTIIDNMIAVYINKPGTYTLPTSGNVIIACPNVTIENTEINGTIYLTQGIDKTEIHLENTVIQDQIVECPTIEEQDKPTQDKPTQDQQSKEDNHKDNDKDDDDDDDKDNEKKCLAINSFKIDQQEMLNNCVSIDEDRVVMNLDQIVSGGEDVKIHEFSIGSDALKEERKVQVTFKILDISIKQEMPVTENGELIFTVEEMTELLNEKYRMLEEALDNMGINSEGVVGQLNYDSLDAFFKPRGEISLSNLDRTLNNLKELYKQEDSEVRTLLDKLSGEYIDISNSNLNFEIQIDGTGIEQTTFEIYMQF